MRGLIVGKFYPPHRGHKFLIDTALAGADEVHVIVCDRPGEDPPAPRRAAWPIGLAGRTPSSSFSTTWCGVIRGGWPAWWTWPPNSA